MRKVRETESEDINVTKRLHTINKKRVLCCYHVKEQESCQMMVAQSK